MAETCDWSSFYEALCRHGPSLLLGIGGGTREMIAAVGSSTDMFWSEGLQELLEEGAADGSVRAGVLSALELWRENVLQTLEANFAIELDWQAVRIDTNGPLIDELVDAATTSKST